MFEKCRGCRPQCGGLCLHNFIIYHGLGGSKVGSQNGLIAAASSTCNKLMSRPTSHMKSGHICCPLVT